MKGYKKIFHANNDQKRARLAILISGKIDFKLKKIPRGKRRILYINKFSV